MMGCQDKQLCQPRAVLFDLDGTLLDSAVHFVEILNRLASTHQAMSIDEQQLRPYVSGGVIAMLRRVFGADCDHETLSALRARFLSDYEALLAHVPATYFSGIELVLDTLRQRQIPYGIVTNKQQRFGERVLAQAFFKESLACVVYGDTLMATKPSPEPVWLACKQMGVEPKSTWFVGDSLVDMQAADRAGCVALLAAYGYVTKDWRRWPAAHVLHQPLDLLDILESVSS